MIIQLWSRDEYGQGNIIGSFSNMEELLNRVENVLTSENFDNCLTFDEKMKNWTMYFVRVNVEGDDRRYFYGESSCIPGKTHSFYVENENSFDRIPLSEMPDYDIEIYLGNLSASMREEKRDWIAIDSRRLSSRKDIHENQQDFKIKDLNHEDLKGKTALFVHIKY